MRKHVLYIGPDLPNGWGEDYATFSPQSIGELREIVGRYINVESGVVVGLDIRYLRNKAQDCILKLLEESRVSVVLRMNELVKGTVLSRVDEIKKSRLSGLKNKLSDVSLEKRGKIGEKVAQLI